MNTFFKESKVIMLPTDKKAMLYTSDDKSYINNTPVYVLKPNGQHLYFTSDEEINEGDWYFDSFNQLILKATSQSDHNIYHYKKVIASTDENLNLPSPPKDFINLFIEEYNEDNQIKEVMIEWGKDEMLFRAAMFEINSTNGVSGISKTNEELNMLYKLAHTPQLKVNPIDNTITIRKIKD